ncbi:DUF3606 domain-containing protein [Luteibacter sp.]|uniref:DUF3606 domain-containing protein n=1 Tax=Luteibacter sp. TaxID=1886636 RepID=UPI00280807D7|nr:DUF3606 domain-containing protein [Luteibacter sp.]MDQ8050850.1 DUF3606 domain-containing protein [Luteibacter sp.]
MSDNTNNRGAADRSRINLNQDHELRYWMGALDVTEDELRAAVRAVGSSVNDVREYLRSA